MLEFAKPEAFFKYGVHSWGDPAASDTHVESRMRLCDHDSHGGLERLRAMTASSRAASPS